MTIPPDAPSSDLEGSNELALAYLARADEGGTAIRAILLAFASAAIGFVFQQFSAELLAHWASLLCFLAGAGLVLWSWDVQKKKAIDRFKALRDREYAAYRRIETPRNFLIDYAAAGLIVVGLIWEFLLAIRLVGPCGSLRSMVAIS